ncbi:MAG: hypothetical protein WAK93_03675 [Solirubrobacteraceae bacterium]
MNNYCSTALDYLKLAYDGERALFSFSSTLDDRGVVVNDFRRPASLRYSINTYLGLSEAERHAGAIDWLGDVSDGVSRFVAQHEPALESSADHGLLLVLLAATDPSHPAAARCLDRIARALSGEGAGRLNMQDLAWMLWGTSCWSQNGRAAGLAERLFDLIRTRFVHPGSGLPRHSVARYRAHTVSFGSIVYYLRAMHSYGEAFDSAAARELFTTGVERVLTIQGDDGGWPWMIDVRTGVPFDLYPIFTVHQDSMAMLFLFPAEDSGIPQVAEAIERSLRWNFGHNELDAKMVHTDPYPWIYRSIERSERWPRARRYLRALGSAPTVAPPRSRSIRINSECRSYHLGWVLYAWSDPARTFPLEATLTTV